jgi:hypothetical protein
VAGFEPFGIDPADLAEQLKIKCAGSTAGVYFSLYAPHSKVVLLLQFQPYPESKVRYPKSWSREIMLKWFEMFLKKKE